MLDLVTRTAILRLRREGHGARTIARAVGVSRNTVKTVLAQGEAQPPPIVRPERLLAHREQIRELFVRCGGNRVRVHEELAAAGVEVAYSTLTEFCRRQDIGVPPKVRAGRYHFAPGEEMQHDTSPHTVVVADTPRRLQCASVVLAYSRLLFAQCYPTFNRFTAKVFLTDAVLWFGGSARRCMVDNTSVVVASGTGKNALIAPEMESFGHRFGFCFAAHAVGDANRSARVERPFHFIERNFYPGRTFADLADLNAQLLRWCEHKSSRWIKQLKASPRELFAAEQPHLLALPLHVPEVYALHSRVVDVEGYVCLHTNRYSVPTERISRRVEVHETKDAVRVLSQHRLVCTHQAAEPGAGQRCTLAEHQDGRFKKTGSAHPVSSPEETTLRAQGGEFVALVEALRRAHGGRALRPLRTLNRLFLDYPTAPLREAIAEALRFGLTDLRRIERMVLRRLQGDFFRLLAPGSEQENPDDR
jgi:transposase